MANAIQSSPVTNDLPPARRLDWVLANPWLWLAAGLGCAIVSWLWTWTQGADANDGRVIVLALGLLLAGVGLWMRWRDRDTLYLESWQAPMALFLGYFFALLFLGATVLFLASFVVEESHGLKSAPLFLVWLSIAPASFVAARRNLNRNPEEPDRNTPAAEEIGFAFVVAAVVCVIGSFTLYADRTTPTDWDTLRMFLRVCAVVCLGAAVLTLVSTALRRLVLSFLFVLHFAGISSAVLSAHPAPWIIQQAWMRLFRPYLEFAYLNNAYHFYAPEPGPSSYLWFRVIYTSPDGTSDEGEWLKVPQLDDKGNIRHPVALDYQRFLCLTEAVMFPENPPAEYYFEPKTRLWERVPFYADRLKLAPNPNEPVMLGMERPKHPRIPFHPDIAPMQQVKIPNDHCKRLLSSYARFVARQHARHPDKSDWEFKSVKVYEVVHWIPPVQWFLHEIPPTDPALYRAYFVGNYDAAGKTIHDGDPYLYWLLPTLRDNLYDFKNSQIRDYARLHAGDAKWIRRGSDKEWVASGQEDR